MPIKWKTKYNVGVKQFDSQHKEIMDKICEMYDEMNAGNKKKVQRNLFNELIVLVEKHFLDEERELEKKEYPEYLDHLEEHKNLLSECRSLKDRYMIGEVKIDLELIGFLENWLLVHVTEMDSRYKHLF